LAATTRHHSVVPPFNTRRSGNDALTSLAPAARGGAIALCRSRHRFGGVRHTRDACVFCVCACVLCGTHASLRVAIHWRRGSHRSRARVWWHARGALAGRRYPTGSCHAHSPFGPCALARFATARRRVIRHRSLFRRLCVWCLTSLAACAVVCESKSCRPCGARMRWPRAFFAV
jgi:hypothetical protein